MAAIAGPDTRALEDVDRRLGREHADQSPGLVDDRQYGQVVVDQCQRSILGVDQRARPDRVVIDQLRDTLVGDGQHEILEFDHPDQATIGVGDVDLRADLGAAPHQRRLRAHCRLRSAGVTSRNHARTCCASVSSAALRSTDSVDTLTVEPPFVECGESLAPDPGQRARKKPTTDARQGCSTRGVKRTASTGLLPRNRQAGHPSRTATASAPAPTCSASTGPRSVTITGEQAGSRRSSTPASCAAPSGSAT